MPVPLLGAVLQRGCKASVPAYFKEPPLRCVLTKGSRNNVLIKTDPAYDLVSAEELLWASLHTDLSSMALSSHRAAGLVQIGG